MTSLYLAMGGSAKIHQLTEAFLKKAMADNLLGQMFAGKLDHADHIAAYFKANFGGPDDYFRERGDLRFLVARHAGLKITEPQRQRWVELMIMSAREVGISAAAVNAFARYLEFPSRDTMSYSNLAEQEALSRLGYKGRPAPLSASNTIHMDGNGNGAKKEPKEGDIND